MEDLSQCRICYETSAENEEPMISPCHCTGSLKYVHASCLNKWRSLNMDNQNRSVCQLCRQQFNVVGEKSAFMLLECLSSKPKQREVGNFLTKQFLYNTVMRGVSLLSLGPLALATSGVSQFATQRNRINVVRDKRLWDRSIFGAILSNRLVSEVNTMLESKKGSVSTSGISWKAAMIYGLSNLGYYGCTWWIFSDGLSEALPDHVNNTINRSTSLILLKTFVEFYVIPSCLSVPLSRKKLVLYMIATGIGILFILKKLERKLRKIAIKLVPRFEEFELGRFSNVSLQ